MAKHSCLKYVALLLIIAGCEEYKYCIEMKPRGQRIERKLTCPANLPKDKKAAIAKLYEKQIDPNIFWGTFDTNLPSDVGGAGFYSTFDTTMGQAAFYSERFRGDDNVNDTLEKVQMIADRCVDFLIGWLEHELGDDPNFVKFKAFCNKNVRHDVKNIAIYFWLSSILPEHNSAGSEEILTRMKHYLIERGYFDPKQMHLFAAGYEGDGKQILRLLRDRIADEMGYSSPQIAAERLGFLSDTKRAEESMEQYIRTTVFFTKAWEAKKLKENDPNAEQPQIDVGEFIMHDIDFDFDLFSDSTVEVKLACTSQPSDMNGQWDEQANQVVWLSRIAGNAKLPTFLYASWSEPDRACQEEHFGQVVLAGEALGQYCMWRNNLDEARGKEWDSFILGLNPGQDLEGRLNDFRFAADRQEKPDEEKSDLAQEPRALILAGLKSEEDKTDDPTTRVDKE
ncbi:MAG TPA: hypothetical protein VMW24_23405 [Sedimentisphaerales bacterium]|nr:hypothetical protein [Sedimentisphaerales bacterium]